MYIISHRGRTFDAPENTLPAVTAALDAGFGVEVDLRSTADGEFVVSHDANLNRLTGVDVNVGELSIEELKSLRIESDNRNYELPTLGDIIDTFSNHASANSRLALHLKGREWGKQVKNLTDKILAYREQLSITLLDRIFVFDVTIETAERFANEESEIEIGLSIGDPDHFPTDRHPTIYRYEDVRERDCWDIVWADEWHGGLYDAEFVRRVREDGRSIVCVSPELHASTVPSHPNSDSPADIWQELISFDVDGICTDFPTKLRPIIQ